MALAISCYSNAQTKTIAMKRHSVYALNMLGYLKSPSNLGMAPEKWVKNSQLKKVIFINDTTQAMVTEETCINEYSYQQQETEKWRAGTDTVTRHPVFSSEISVDSMRTILKKEYYFQNDMKDVKFIGFDQKPNKNTQKKVEKNKKETETSQKSIIPYSKYGFLFLVFASSLGIGIVKIK